MEIIGDPQQQDAVFYSPSSDSEVVWSEEGNDYVVLRAGEMRAIYSHDYTKEDLYTTRDFITSGLDTDDKVAVAEREVMLEWIYNPWFEVANRTIDMGWSDEVFHTISEAVERAKHLNACQHPNIVNGECADCYEGGKPLGN